MPGAKPLGGSEAGVNSTFLGFVDIEEGQRIQAYIKDLAPKQLANELLATVIGRSLNLPIPKGVLVRAQNRDISLNNAPNFDSSSKLVFASENVGSPGLARRFKRDMPFLDSGQLKKICSGLLLGWPDLGFANAYDEWIANVDRHLNNLLFGGRSTFWLIDHDRAFTGPDWSKSDLSPGTQYANRLIEEILHSDLDTVRKTRLCDDAREFEKNAQKIGSSDLMDGSQVTTAGVISADEQTKLVEFVDDRSTEIAKLVEERLGMRSLV